MQDYSNVKVMKPLRGSQIEFVIASAIDREECHDQIAKLDKRLDS